MERLELSEVKLVKEEGHILGNFTSVIGEYYIPQIDKTAFFKLNGCVIGGEETEDLRELLASKIMGRIGFPHADILLAKDDEQNNGCLSINILKKGEYFAEPKGPYAAINNVEDFINDDLRQISTIQGITEEDLKARKEYLLKYLLISALILNTDLKMDNMFIIKNTLTGTFRNPEYYDMGASFVEGERSFFYRFSANQIIEQLYEMYPTWIVPFGRQIQEKLTKSEVKELLGEEVFKGFSKETIKSIRTGLFDRIDLIKMLNSKEKNNFLYGIDDLHNATKDTDLSLRDKVKIGLLRFRDKIIGRDKDE